MNTVFGLNFFVFCILVLIVVMYFTKGVRDEGFQEKGDKEGFFGKSPGTDVQRQSLPSLGQMAASRPPTDVNVRPNQQIEDAAQESTIQRDLLDMTESGSFDVHYASA